MVGFRKSQEDNADYLKYLMIVSIACSISSISCRYRQQSPEAFLYDLIGLDKYNDKETKDEYQYVRAQNPEHPSSNFFLNTEERNFDKYLPSTMPEDRKTRYLEDNNVQCEVEISKGYFVQEGYEFFPSEYINKTCSPSKSDAFIIESNGIRKPEICFHNDNVFGCQTLFEQLNVLRNNTKTGGPHCWEHFTQLVAVGCKCNIRFTY